VVGTVQPIRELASMARSRKVLFHTDAVQSVPSIPVDVRDLGVDLLSMSAHKFHGPKGVGALYMRLGVHLPPDMTGGGQEKGLRSGTENVPGIVGMAAALEETVKGMPEESERLRSLSRRLVEGVLEIPGSQLTGHPEERLPGLSSFVFDGIRDSTLVVNRLSDEGIFASSGSACNAGAKEAPHVLTAMGFDPLLSRSSLRLSLSRQNTMEDVDFILEILPKVIASMRADRNTMYGLPMG
jgi:cysteine desulfurase